MNLFTHLRGKQANTFYKVGSKSYRNVLSLKGIDKPLKRNLMLNLDKSLSKCIKKLRAITMIATVTEENK